MSEWIVDISESDFEQSVVERSKHVPIIVDFWAPWCGPCRTLSPLLERLANEHAGAFILAKVNVDRNPNLAAAFGVRSIPMVLGLREGRVVAEFVGALPESEVREFLTRVLPSASDQLARRGQQLYGEGRASEAEAAFRQALELDARCDRALLGLAALLADRRADREALDLLDRVAPTSPVRQDADRLAAEIRIRQVGGTDETALRAKLSANPSDIETRFALAQTLAANGRYDEALREYLEIVTRDRNFRDDAARRAMLDVFELLGPGNELAERYRSELAKVLFR